jgi:hypothetical protein
MLLFKVSCTTDGEKYDRSSWIEHPHTARVTSAAKQCFAHASEELMSACRNSTDPNVRGAYARLMAITEMGKVLNGTD